MGVEVVHQPVHGLGRWMGFGNPRKGLGKLRRLAMGRGVSVMTTAGGLDENIGRSRFRRARIHSRGARPGLAPSEYQVAPNPAVAPAVRPGRPLATRGSARWLRISHTSSIRRTYSCPASRHPHIFSRHGFSSWRVNSRRMVSRRPWRPARGAWLHLPSARWSTVPDLSAAGRTPSPRSQPALWHQAAAPVWAAGGRSARLLTHAPNSASLFVALPADRCSPPSPAPQVSSPDPATPKSEFAASSARLLPVRRSSFASVPAAPRSSISIPATAAPAGLLPHSAFDQILRPNASYPVILTSRSQH
jgi:hypothetical protein